MHHSDEQHFCLASLTEVLQLHLSLSSSRWEWWQRTETLNLIYVPGVSRKSLWLCYGLEPLCFYPTYSNFPVEKSILISEPLRLKWWVSLPIKPVLNCENHWVWLNRETGSVLDVHRHMGAQFLSRLLCCSCRWVIVFNEKCVFFFSNVTISHSSSWWPEPKVFCLLLPSNVLFLT